MKGDLKFLVPGSLGCRPLTTGLVLMLEKNEMDSLIISTAAGSRSSLLLPFQLPSFLLLKLRFELRLSSEALKQKKKEQTELILNFKVVILFEDKRLPR